MGESKLNQIIAVLNGKKTKAQEELTALNNAAKKPVLFEGIKRTYKPLTEGGLVQPPESKNVQMTVKQVIAKTREILGTVWDLTATQDIGNCKAIVDVKIGERVLIKQVPVTHLLYLEKQLEDLRTVIANFPVLDAAEAWEWTDAVDSYRTKEPTIKYRTEKVPNSYEKSAATDKHPAQVEFYWDDRPVGTWTEIRYSGAIEAKQKNAMLERVTQLRDAVKIAREEGNSIKLEKADIANSVFDFIFDGKLK